MHEETIFWLSHLGATELGVGLGLRSAHNEVGSINSRRIFLGAILRKNPFWTGRQFDYLTVLPKLEIKNVIRVLNPAELKSELFDRSRAPSVGELEAEDCKPHDIHLMDFTYHWNPEIHNAFADEMFRVFERIQKGVGNVYVHCKAGVNRSFKVVVALIVYSRFLCEYLEGNPINELKLRRWIIDACNHVRGKRPEVDFYGNNRALQVDFIYQLFARHLGERLIKEQNSIHLFAHNKLCSYVYNVTRNSLWYNADTSRAKKGCAASGIESLENGKPLLEVLITLEKAVEHMKEGELNKMIDEIRFHQVVERQPDQPARSPKF